jgi:serine/threonine-protein kinase
LGSLGPVFRGADDQGPHPVTIKPLQLSLGPERTRAVADELAALVERVPRHPHLATLLAAGLVDGVPTVVAELAPGEGLDAALRTYGPAAFPDAVERLAAIAGALDHAAAHGVWHGALHPCDIIIAAAETHVTGVGITPALEKVHVPAPMRPPYTAPEVAASRRSSARADQFALAAIAHEWLFGRTIDGPADAALTLPRLPDVDAEALAGAFTTALAPDPADRFDSCTAFVEALRAAAQTRAAGVLPVQGDLLDARAGAGDPGTELASAPLQNPPESAHVEPLAAAAPDEERRPPGRAAHDELPLVVEPATAAARDEDTAPIAWRGAIGAARPDPAPSGGIGAAALAAVFVVGLGLGALGGYLFAQRPARGQTAGGAAVTATVPPASAKAATAEAESAAPSGRVFTDATVPVAGATAAARASNTSNAATAAAPAAPAPAPAPPRAAGATPANATARLLVRSSPAGASVMVDGVARGETPLVLRDLPIGARELVIARRGYQTVERRITLTGDRPSRSIDVTLAPVARPAPARPAPPAAGSVVVESRPAGASVTIDGRPAGVTPLTIASVAAGRHTVVIAAPGMRPVTTTIDVKAGERSRVAATLVGGRQQE